MGVSIRAYARHRGVAENAVRKAIKAGRITPDSNGKIDVAKADAAWEANTDTPSGMIRQDSRISTLKRP